MLCWGRRFRTGGQLLHVSRTQGQVGREERGWTNGQGGRVNVLMMNLIFIGDYISYASLNGNKMFYVKLPLLCRTCLPSALILPVEVHRGRGFEGGIWPSAAMFQARLAFPPGRL